MIRSTTKYLFVILFGLGVFYSCKEAKATPSANPMNRTHEHQTELTEKEAIQLAEQFVKDNGYTNAPANKSNISYELMDQTGEDVSAILERRHNNLHPNAFCISDHDDVWHIGFLSTKVDISNPDELELNGNLSGRAIIVDHISHKVRIAHKDPLFSMFRKL
ncbi:MAG: hypothetical protein A3D31_07095 [Candidatus Fluviicola riflensis]|nr:MAG: hypothetical protein CHH17_07915 [Candidatus Fluviicola riflensis]OGS79717.1 MAG: hypothetical protein A3D31_07095 [Candidatus Fluviicola riflensis]OGS87150.1 MAG: hypothetical protein A2724_06555 [Fluviicola sp. RIFCSPHIGHO2_01_FULL_43_53]OGS89938.1 MAG: hypothetical protein A3E30_03300 [Fluviicola sp. RIFCSPHIGHO2_12_FULL_43_24]